MRKGIQRFVLLIAVVSLLAGCVTPSAVEPAKPNDWAQQRPRILLNGTWYGESRTKDGGKRQEIVHHRLDGTFTTRFRVIGPSGNVQNVTEVGLWGISGGVYFTITKGWLRGKSMEKADPTDANYNDTYRVVKLIWTEFRYRSLQTGDEYSEVKVPDTFDFPAP